MRFILSFISIVYLHAVSAQTTVIYGLAPSYIGKTAYMQVTLDPISFIEETIASGMVASDSTFRLEVLVKETTPVLLCISNTCGYLYLEPGKTYNVLFDGAQHKTAYNLNRSFIEVIFEDLPETDINYRILAFHTFLDNFLQLNFYELLDPELFKALDTFKLALTQQFNDVRDPFFIDYVTYYIADVERITHVKGDREKNKASSYNAYLYRQPVRMNHPAYMRYLLNYFENYLSLSTRDFERQLYQNIMKLDVAAIRGQLASDRYLQDSLIREIILIKSLADLHETGDFPNDKVEKCMEKLGYESLYIETRNMAQRVHQRMINLKLGTVAPMFSLEAVSGDSVQLTDYLGKYLYITFFNTMCTPCAAELNIMPRLKERYGESIEFLTIAVDDTPSNVMEFVSKNRQISWPVLLQDPRSQVLRDYAITGIPQYILIDPKGNILQSPALSPSPSGNFVSIDKTFFDIQKSLSPEREEWDKRR